MERIKDSLRRASSGATDDEIADALTSAVSWAVSLGVSSSHDELHQYESLARIMTDQVAERLGSSASSSESGWEQSFDKYFLLGPPEPAFRTLVSGLRISTWSADACARTLLLFVNRKLDGARRLAQVISNSSRAGEATLVHLPSKIYNVLLNSGVNASELQVNTPSAASNSRASCDPRSGQFDVLDDYYVAIAEALVIANSNTLRLSTKNTNSSVLFSPRYVYSQVAEPRTAMSRLIAKLCTVGKAAILVKYWFEREDLSPAHVSELAMLAAESAVPTIVRCFASYDLKLKSSISVQRHFAVLRNIFSSSTTARDFACFHLPFCRPLISSKFALSASFVQATVRSGSGVIGFETTARRWSDQSFASSSDVGLQQQVTRILLLYMRVLFTSDPSLDVSRWMVVIASGVSSRLSSSHAKIRRYGMLVGEMVSSLHKEVKPVRFPRPAKREVPEYDSDSEKDSVLSDIVGMNVNYFSGSDSDAENSASVNVASDADVDAVQIRLRLDRDVDDSDMPVPTNRRSSPDSHKNSITGETQDALPQAWWQDDDWSSLESLGMSSDEDLADEYAASEGKHGDRGQFDADHLHRMTEQSRQDSAEFHEQDYLVVKKTVSAPLSAVRILAMIRKLNGDDHDLSCQPDVIISTLRLLRDRALWLRTQKSRASTMQRENSKTQNLSLRRAKYLHAANAGFTLKCCAKEMVMAVFHIDCERFPHSHVTSLSEAREAALVALTALDLKQVGEMLISNVFCGKTADVSRREEALDILCKTIRHVAADEEVSNDAENFEGPDEQNSPQASLARGRVVRHLPKTIRARKQLDAKKDSAIRIDQFAGSADTLFFSIANGLDTGRGNSMTADFIDLSQRDSYLAAHAIAALGLILSRTSAQCTARDDMCISLIQICCAYRSNTDVTVRRAVALGLGSAARMTSVRMFLYSRDAMTSAAVGHSVLSLAVSWLQDSANGADADLYVRRFAASSLQVWSEKFEDMRSV